NVCRWDFARPSDGLDPSTPSSRPWRYAIWRRSGERTLAHATVYPPDVADRTFATPEEAAMADFPPQYARVDGVTYSRRGKRAKVALLTNNAAERAGGIDRAEDIAWRRLSGSGHRTSLS